MILDLQQIINQSTEAARKCSVTRLLTYFQSKVGWRGFPKPMSIMLVVPACLPTSNQK
jgi:hypothetical protein